MPQPTVWATVELTEILVGPRAARPISGAAAPSNSTSLTLERVTDATMYASSTKATVGRALCAGVKLYPEFLDLRYAQRAGARPRQLVEYPRRQPTGCRQRCSARRTMRGAPRRLDFLP